MNFDVVTFGSATQDIFVRSKEFKLINSSEFPTGKTLAVGAGEKVYVEELVFASGGGGTNCAATFSLQGLGVSYVGLVGNDLAGRNIIKDLHRLGITADFIKITNKAKTPVSIILSAPGEKEESAFVKAPTFVKTSAGKSADAQFCSCGSIPANKIGERSILVYEGASHLLGKEDIPWGKIQKTRWFYVSGLSGESSKVFPDIINFAEENKIKLAVNPGHDQLGKDLEILKSLLDKIDILIVNEEEASIITGIEYKEEEEIFKKFDELVPGIAVITKGKKGAAVSDGENIYRAGIPESGYVDRTGAGDAFASGFVSAIIKGESIEFAIQFATANATSCVQQLGAKNGLLKKGEWGEWDKIQVQKSKRNKFLTNESKNQN